MPRDQLGAEASAAPTTLAHGTLAEAIRTGLADDIIGGRLAPGSEIDEQHLADRFGASRTPVREALRDLAAAGLVSIEPRRGVRVTAPTLDRLDEMFEVMAETEAMCVRLATHRMTGAERAALLALHQRMGTAALAQDLDAYDGLNRRFHAAIDRATHNAYLAEHTRALRLRLAPFRRAQLGGADRLPQSHAEHAAVLHALLRGDGEEAGRLMRAHMLAASASLAEYLADQP